MPVHSEQKESRVGPLDISSEVETLGVAAMDKVAPVSDDFVMEGGDVPPSPSSSSTSSLSTSAYEEADAAAVVNAAAGGSATAPHNPGLVYPRDTVIVFDWDDTLLSSSFLAARGHTLDSDLAFEPEVAEHLRKLEQSVIEALTLAQQHGTVVVITNAETGWVQLSAQKFIPAVLPVVQKLDVVSARSTYESLYPDAPLKWKYCAFYDRLSNLFAEAGEAPKNIISFGDSQVEREAVRAVSRNFSNAMCKSVKFAERPSLEQLVRQVELVTNCFHSILTHDGDLDLMLIISLMHGN